MTHHSYSDILLFLREAFIWATNNLPSVTSVDTRYLSPVSTSYKPQLEIYIKATIPSKTQPKTIFIVNC